jgi:hypothetical protein
MRRQAVPNVLAMVAFIVGIDVLFFRNNFWPRLVVNVGIVLVSGAFYWRFLHPRHACRWNQLSGRILERSQTRGCSANEAKQDTRFGAAGDRETVAIGRSQVACGDGSSHVRDVATGQLAGAAHLDAPERPHRFEHHQDAPRVVRQVAMLHIVLGNHHLEGSVPPAIPDGRHERTPVFPVGRQHSR